MTERERKAILERDGHKCQGCGIFNFCPRERWRIKEDRLKLEVHHVIPQRYARDVGIINPDYALNLVSVCEVFHRGHPESIHPDTHAALWKYREGNKGAFREMGAERIALLQLGQTYWNTAYDRELAVIAARNTQNAESTGWEWPKRKD